MKNGLLRLLRRRLRPHAKWLSLARVLADTSSAGAVYVDVRLPGTAGRGLSPGDHDRATSSSDAGRRHRIDGGGTGRWSRQAAKTEPSTEHEEPESSAGGEPSEATTEPSTAQAPAEALGEAPAGNL